MKLNGEFKVEFDFAATMAAAMTGCQMRELRQADGGAFGPARRVPGVLGVSRMQDHDEFQDAMKRARLLPFRERHKPKMPEVDIKCEKCGAPMAVKMSRRGPFLACTGYPKCKNAKPLPDEIKAKMPKAAPKAPPVMTDEKCDKCGAPMARRQGRYGEFLGCSAYPKCKNIKKLPSAANA